MIKSKSFDLKFRKNNSVIFFSVICSSCMLFTAVYEIASIGLKRNKGLNSMEGYYLNPGISWDMFPVKAGIHSSVWSTKHFCTISGSRDIRKLKRGIRFQDFLILDDFVFGNIDVTYCLAYILAPLMFYRNGFKLEACLRMSPLKWDITEP